MKEKPNRDMKKKIIENITKHFGRCFVVRFRDLFRNGFQNAQYSIKTERFIVKNAQI